MHKRIIIFRGKPVDSDTSNNYDMVFSTGDILQNIIQAIKPHADDCTIYLQGCESMVHFRAILSDNFPKAIVQHI